MAAFTHTASSARFARHAALCVPPLKLRPYGGIEMCVLLLLFTQLRTATQLCAVTTSKLYGK